MKNVLLTGVTGLTGSAVARNLLENYPQVNIVGVHHGYLSDDRLKYQGIFGKGIFFEKADINNYHRMRELINKYEIDSIIHLAAVTIVRIASRDPLVCFNANVVGTLNLLEAARQSTTVKTFIGATSDKAYGDHEVLPYKEDFAIQPLHTYAGSKGMADILLRTFAHQYDMNICVVRSCNVYGPGDFNYTRIIPNSVRRINDGDQPVIWEGVNEYIREFIYVDDAASAIVAIQEGMELDPDHFKGQAFNLSTGDVWKVEDMVNHIAKVMNSDIRAHIEPVELEFQEIIAQYLDGSKLREYTGWTPKYTIENGGLENTVRWLQGVFKDGVK